MYTEDDDPRKDLTPAEAFRLAKIDHYLQQASECAEMGRLLAAMKTLDMVFALDAGNQEGKGLLTAVHDTLSQMLEKGTNGHATTNADGTPLSRTRRSELVMVVDQDERVLTSLTATLRRYGFMAIGASSYEEAIESFTTAKPDVVISEVNFESGPRGFDLYSWVMTNSVSGNLPFLFLATRIDRDTLIAGKRFGVDDLIVKPVDDDVVIASVINCLTRRKTLPVRA